MYEMTQNILDTLLTLSRHDGWNGPSDSQPLQSEWCFVLYTDRDSSLPGHAKQLRILTREHSDSSLTIEIEKKENDSRNSSPVCFTEERFPSAKTTLQDTMNRIISYIQEHYMEPLTVDSISERFYISKYHLMREFKRYTGSTIHTFLLNERIARAQAMISHGMNAGEASNTVGFSDYSLFYRAFVKITGMTPKEYGNRMVSA